MGKIQKIKRTLGVLLLGLGVFGFAGLAQAAPVSGKVYLDYDNSASLANSPPTLSGVNVELLDGAGAPLSPAVTDVTDANGNFTLETPSIGKYQIKAMTATAGEEGITNITVIGSAPVMGNTIFLKGLGGDLTLAVNDGVNGLQGISVNVSSMNMSKLYGSTDSSGQLIVRNTLLGGQYLVSVDPDDIIADTNNGKNYALWDVTFNGTNSYSNKIDFIMSGSTQSGIFNVLERNNWGADGIVAIDQNDDGIYSGGIDMGTAGFKVELYYQGTTTQVLNQPAIITGENGKYNFKNLALANYTVAVTNIDLPYLPVTATTANFSVSTPSGSPSAFNFLVKVGASSQLPKISGYAFILPVSSGPVAGPDSGKTGITKPTSKSTTIQTPIKLYQHDGSAWQLISTLNSGSDGSYAFSGLVSGKDYKVVIDESGINTGFYYFIGDTDGKSSDTSAASLSSHKGKVTLSNGSQNTITGKEIILPNLTNVKEHQNFWYATINNKSTIHLNNYLASLNGKDSWGGIINGLSASSMTAYFKGTFYEEDGVTPARNSDNSLFPQVEYPLAAPDGYGLVNRVSTKIDHGGFYQFIIDEYDDQYVKLDFVSPLLISASSGENHKNIRFIGKTPNSISGHIYINNSHPGTVGSYNPAAGDIPVYASRVILERKQVSSPEKWQRVSFFSGDEANGYFNFTNLPDGDYRITATTELGSESNIDASEVEFEGNISGSSTTIAKQSILEMSVAGGQTLTDQDFWLKSKSSGLTIKGRVFLDVYLKDSVLQIVGSDYKVDAPLYGATVLLCHDGAESDCTVGGSNYITHQVTTVSGEYQFTSDVDGITVGTDYMIKAVKDDLTVVNQGDLAPYYVVGFSRLDLPIKKNFLLQGKGLFAGKPVNDFNGDMRWTTNENGVGRGWFYYYDTAIGDWVRWFTVGHYSNEYSIESLEQGRYKLVHSSSPAYLDLADSDINSPAGTMEFEVLADGSIADGKGSTNRFIYQARDYALTEGVSGQIYLDVSGLGVMNSQAIPLPASELAGVLVKGYFTPRLYPDYTIGETEVLNAPDFIDSQVAINNGRFSHNAANSTAGAVYTTNYLLELEGLNTNKFTLVANSGPKQSYLSTAIQDDLAYMQVTATNAGAPDQYWLVQLNRQTGISGRLYYDLNDNGQYDSGVDTPMSGVRVELWKEGALYTYALSDNNGQYTFIGILDGVYTVKSTTVGLDTSLYELNTDNYDNLTIDLLNSPTMSDIDFLHRKVGEASISGNVMLDINNNGVVDIDFNKYGDLALSGVKVELYKGSVTGTPYRTLQTNSKGYYSFSGIDLNTDYIIKVIPTNGYGVISNADHTTSDLLATISIGPTPSFYTDQFFLLAGDSNNNPTGGNSASEATTSGISGKTLIDDVSNTPFAGVLIGLINGNNVEIARQVTDNDGQYHFYNLPADTYKIVVINSPEGYYINRNTAGDTPPLNELPGIVLSSTGISNQSFWYITAGYGIEGSIYVDFAANNTSLTLDSNDHPLSGVTVELYEGTGAVAGNKIADTITNADGLYLFDNLAYGPSADYSVKLDMSTIPDYQFALSLAGNTSKDVVINITGLSKDGSLDQNYIVTGRLNVAGDVWQDKDISLSQTPNELTDGVTVNLNYKAPGASSFSLLKSMTTGTSPATVGQYLFAQLPKNTDYEVVVDSDSAVLTGLSLMPSTGAISIADNTNVFTLNGLAADSITHSTAYIPSGKVSGQLIIDVDGSDSYLSGVDMPFAGINLELSTTISGNVVTHTATTDSMGRFAFDYLADETWQLNVAATQTVANWSDYQLGFVKNSAGAIATGSTALPVTIPITIADSDFANIDIGYQGSAKISGYLVSDSDPSDGTHMVTGIDTPLAGVTITLSSNNAGFVSRTTTTNSSGYYEFDRLAEHTYKVSIDTTNSQLTGLVASFAPTGSLSSEADIVVSAPNSELTLQDFGYKSINQLSGYVYRDLSGQGIAHDSIDDGLAGVRIKATQGSLVRYSDVTTADGAYLIDNLPSGLWTVELDTLPSAYHHYSYISETVGVTATQVANGAEIELSQTGVTAATASFGIKASVSISGGVVIDVDDTAPSPANIDTTDIAIDALFPDYVVELYAGSPGSQVHVASSVVSGGAYSFTGLSNNVNYRIQVSAPDNSYVGSFNVLGNVVDGSGVTTSQNISATMMEQSYAFTNPNQGSEESNFGWKGAGNTVSGQLIIDIDGNDSYLAGVDLPLAGINLELSSTIGGTVITKTATTDSDGQFNFPSLFVANWSLKASTTQTVTDWSDYQLGFVKNSAGAITTGDSALPLTIPMTVTETNFDNIDIGYKGSAKISGYVVVDADPTDGSHAVASIDTPLEGITVTLGSNSAGFVNRTTTTNNLGYYEFDHLAAHTYNVSIDTTNSLLVGHVASFDPLGSALSAVDIAVAAANSQLVTQDFGYKSNGNVSGYIYRDLSGSGIAHDSLDDGLAGVRIKATQGAVVRYSNVTATDGAYLIDNLATGLWAIELDTLPSANHGYSYIRDTVGATATVIPNGAEVEINPTLTRDAVKAATVSFGVKSSGVISGRVVIDVDDTIPSPADIDAADIDVDILYPSYMADLYIGSVQVASSAVTNGAYSFSGLSDNIDYRIQVSAPDNSYANSFNVASTSSGVTIGELTNSALMMSQTYTLALPNTVATDSHFGWKGAGSITGDIFWDKDDDGVYTAGVDDSLNSPITITFTQNGLPPIIRTLTAGSTNYSVTGMIPGNWTLDVSSIVGDFKPSFDPDDAHNTTSMPNTANKAIVAIGSTALSDKNFGYIQGGAMQGVIKNDETLSGVYDPSAPGIGGIEVELLDSLSNPMMSLSGTPIVATSNDEGNFTFRNLDATQDYKVRVAFGSATTSLLADMEPSYDSVVGSIDLNTPPANIDLMHELHSIDVLFSAIPGSQLEAVDVHFGYRIRGGDLTIHKEALKDNVVVGDLVPYRISIENNQSTSALNMAIRDLIPAGFKYVSGSARLDGEKIADPTGGRSLIFKQIDLGGNAGTTSTPSKRSLTYILVVGAGVTQGQYVNTAVAMTATGAEASNVSDATVTVTSDPLFNDSLIFGKVYVDRNSNGIQDEGEEGLGGIKLVTARGEIITTDAQGRYHLAGVNGGRWERGTNFILKLDARSLPKGYKVIGRNPIVVRLSPGLPSKIDFKVSDSK